MRDKIYRNGKQEREKTEEILLKNLGFFLIPIITATVIVYWLNVKMEYANSIVDLAVFAIALFGGFCGYMYRTVTRLRPLAYIDGDNLIINSSLFRTNKINLSLVTKISCQNITEHNQLMKVKSPGEIPIEIEIKQTNCSTEDLGNFITKNHEIDVTYS